MVLTLLPESLKTSLLRQMLEFARREQAKSRGCDQYYGWQQLLLPEFDQNG
jgi:hypothetical protein